MLMLYLVLTQEAHLAGTATSSSLKKHLPSTKMLLTLVGYGWFSVTMTHQSKQHMGGGKVFLFAAVLV